MSAGGYHAVVLAAGAGSRFGGSKLTAAFEGGVLLDAALGIACAAPVESVVVVTGAHGDAVGAAVAAFASSGPPVHVVNCPDHASGMSASLRRGLAALPENAVGAFIFLGDMPRVPRTISLDLLDAVLAGSPAAIPSVNGRWGHPVLVARPLFDAFSRGAGDGGGRRVLRSLGGDLAVVETNDDGILADADTPAELEAIVEAMRSRSRR